MTRGESRILGVLESGFWCSVGMLHLNLGYSREFVEKTTEALYWDSGGRGRRGMLRAWDGGDWWYRFKREGKNVPRKKRARTTQCAFCPKKTRRPDWVNLNQGDGCFHTPVCRACMKRRGWNSEHQGDGAP